MRIYIYNVHAVTNVCNRLYYTETMVSMDHYGAQKQPQKHFKNQAINKIPS